LTWAYLSSHEEFQYPNLDGIIADLRTAPRNLAGVHVDGPLAGDLACDPETGLWEFTPGKSLGCI